MKATAQETSISAPSAGKEAPPLDLRAILRRVYVAWAFGAAWSTTVSGATLTRYAKLLGVSEFGFGLLSAMPYLAALMQLPMSWLIERYGQRKEFFLVFNLTHRAVWLLIAWLPPLFPAPLRPWALLHLMMFSIVMAQLGVPAWFSWIMDLVPSRLRGRYFSRRVQLGQIVSLLLTGVIGFALDLATGKMLQFVISLLLTAAATLGLVDILLFRDIPDHRRQQRNPRVSPRILFGEPLHNRDFLHYLGYTATITFGIAFNAQFVWLYFFDVARMSNSQANLLLVTVSLLVTLFSTPLWGRAVDRFGCRTTALAAGFCIIHGSAVFIFVQRENWIWGYAISLISTAAWPGLELASQTLLLRMSGTRRADRQNSAYIAINSFVAAIAGTLSGLFGGAFARILRDWNGSFFGWPLTYHGLLFILSGCLRALALLWLRRIREPRAAAPQDVLRYVATHMYSNFQGALLLPVRWLGRWTERVHPRRIVRPNG